MESRGRLGTMKRMTATIAVLSVMMIGCSDTSQMEADIAEHDARIAVLEQQAGSTERPPVESITTTKPSTTTEATTTSRATTTTLVSIGVDDFDVTLIELSNKCFGSAGANIEMRAELSVSDRARNGTGAYLVIYEVSPLEDGANTYNIEVDLDDGTYEVDTLLLSTADCDDVPVATVTSVLAN